MISRLFFCDMGSDAFPAKAALRGTKLFAEAIHRKWALKDELATVTRLHGYRDV